MNIRKVTYIFLALFLTGGALTLSNQHSRWLAFNGMAASKLSNQLLSHKTPKTPDWAIDLVIVSNPKEQTVSFSGHHSEFTYVYSAKQEPLLSNYKWRHLIGSWYVGKIKT